MILVISLNSIFKTSVLACFSHGGRLSYNYDVILCKEQTNLKVAKEIPVSNSSVFNSYYDITLFYFFFRRIEDDRLSETVRFSHNTVYRPSI